MYAFSISPSGLGSPRVSLQIEHCGADVFALCSGDDAVGFAEVGVTRFPQGILNVRNLLSIELRKQNRKGCKWSHSQEPKIQLYVGKTRERDTLLSVFYDAHKIYVSHLSKSSSHLSRAGTGKILRITSNHILERSSKFQSQQTKYRSSLTVMSHASSKLASKTFLITIVNITNWFPSSST